ncbi:hypothetical protein [Streptomyces sp. NPDC058295]|uniref:hypothetical protein n=1 Tax=Streptomyces sp. NPDC058295 TaxID=3346431 RepID=UPI0036E8FAC3
MSKLFLHTMSGQMYENLKKLTSGNFGNYVMGSALERELRHLRDIGYIRVHSISSVPPEGENLSQYVSVTEAGSQFVALREKAAAERNKKPENTQTS